MFELEFFRPCVRFSMRLSFRLSNDALQNVAPKRLSSVFMFHIDHIARYSELSTEPFKDFWRN